ncbi:hypothetical protein F4808DRAFT_436604 [Astrocystis sublimbata]|nr:hypothetical protein F4808DRAFT_436604 [Astrocystis sublimbata]
MLMLMLIASAALAPSRHWIRVQISLTTLSCATLFTSIYWQCSFFHLLATGQELQGLRHATRHRTSTILVVILRSDYRLH